MLDATGTSAGRRREGAGRGAIRARDARGRMWRCDVRTPETPQGRG